MERRILGYWMKVPVVALVTVASTKVIIGDNYWVSLGMMCIVVLLWVLSEEFSSRQGVVELTGELEQTTADSNSSGVITKEDLGREMLMILDQVRYWETCPVSIKEKIQMYLGVEEYGLWDGCSYGKACDHETKAVALDGIMKELIRIIGHGQLPDNVPGIINSYGDTLSDDEILDCLKSEKTPTMNGD